MSSKKQAAGNAVCINFCKYYKPGKSEELQCQGFVVVQGLIREGRHLPQEKPLLPSSPDAETVRHLKNRVCTACSFREHDCDFILTQGVASPCGGIAFLSHLLGSGRIKREDI